MKVTITADDENSSDSEGCGLVVVDPRTHDCPVFPNPRNMTKVVSCLMSFGVSGANVAFSSTGGVDPPPSESNMATSVLNGSKG